MALSPLPQRVIPARIAQQENRKKRAEENFHAVVADANQKIKELEAMLEEKETENE